MMTKHLRNQSGMTLPETIVAAMLLGLTITVAFQIVTYAVNETSRGRGLLTRDRIVMNLVNYASMPAAIRASAQAPAGNEPFNEGFKDCVYDRPTLCYTNNSGAGFRPFRLYMPTVENPDSADGSPGEQTTIYTSGAITGTPAKPMRYSPFGHMCDTNVEACPVKDYPMEAFTEFIPYCPENFQMGLRKYGGHSWNGPIYPPDPRPADETKDALRHMPHCYGAKYMKIRLTVQPSDFTSGTSSLNFPPFVTNLYVDIKQVYNGRQ